MDGASHASNTRFLNDLTAGSPWLVACYSTGIMQIPYDLEFVENRPTVQVRAVALEDTYPFAARGARRRREGDAFDALLHWVHRVIARLDSRSR